MANGTALWKLFQNEVFEFFHIDNVAMPLFHYGQSFGDVFFVAVKKGEAANNAVFYDAAFGKAGSQGSLDDFLPQFGCV